MQLCKHMLEMLKGDFIFLFVFADLKHSLDCISFCSAHNAMDGFLKLNDYCRMMVLLHSALSLSDLD